MHLKRMAAPTCLCAAAAAAVATPREPGVAVAPSVVCEGDQGTAVHRSHKRRPADARALPRTFLPAAQCARELRAHGRPVVGWLQRSQGLKRRREEGARDTYILSLWRTGRCTRLAAGQAQHEAPLGAAAPQVRPPRANKREEERREKEASGGVPLRRRVRVHILLTARCGLWATLGQGGGKGQPAGE